MHARSRKLYVYFETIRGAWIGRRMHPDPLLGSRIPVRHWIQTALELSRGPQPKESLFARKNWNFFLRAQTGIPSAVGLVKAQSPADSDGVISFLSRAADPVAFCWQKPSLLRLQCARTSTVLQYYE